MRKTWLILSLFLMMGGEPYSRDNSTRKNLQAVDAEVAFETSVDTVKVINMLEFDEDVVTLRGYAKRASESLEAFMLSNNTNLYISSVKLRLVYTDLAGNMVHEREEMIECDLPAYSSKQIAIKSFDKSKRFYYHKSKSGKGAIPYNIAVKILSYDVRINCDK